MTVIPDQVFFWFEPGHNAGLFNKDSKGNDFALAVNDK
jgi:hypothetical protein